MKTVVTDFNVLTPDGLGLDACWDGLLAGASMLAEVDRFDTSAFHSHVAGIVPGLEYHRGDSLVFQMLEKLFPTIGTTIPADARLILASTNGEVDLLERAVLDGGDDVRASGLDFLLEKVRGLCGVDGAGQVVSSACISSTAALAMGAAAISDDECDCVLVVACDPVTEFIYSGFSSLMALDSEGARPFDANRAGLSVGEAAGYVLLMGEERAQRENRPVACEISGWGLSSDANHMTGPSRDGSGLASAIKCSLRLAGVDEKQIGFVSAHGTGTQYNDAMEMLAFKLGFSTPRPIFATGLVETALVARAFNENLVPPTVRLEQADANAAGWVSASAVGVDCEFALKTNAGFGGVNAALVLRKPEVAR